MKRIKVLVRSKQPGIIAQHMSPSFKYRFETSEPIEVREDHARFLVRTNPNFEIVYPSPEEPKIEEKELEEKPNDQEEEFRPENLESWTKDELETYAKDIFSVDLDKRKTKSSLIEEITGLEKLRKQLREDKK